MKTYGGGGGIAPHIDNLDSRMEVSGQLHDPASLTPGKHHPVPIG
jgi:hypothetical protein